MPAATVATFFAQAAVADALKNNFKLLKKIKKKKIITFQLDSFQQDHP